MIDRNLIQRVKDEANLVNLVGESVKLRRRGGKFTGLCPFHNEKTPSFFVDPKRNSYHCFGCSEHGDTIEWLIKQQGMSFKEAVQDLAGQIGVDLAYENDSKWRWSSPPIAQPPQPSPIIDWPESAIEGFARRMPRYLVDRGVSMDAARAFGLGYDRDTERATFPVRKSDGTLVGVTGRSTRDRQPKYLHYQLDRKLWRAVPWVPRKLLESLSEDEIEDRFRAWPRNRLLFGANVVRWDVQPPGGWKSDDLFLVEGHVDAVMTWQRGHRSVATMGTFVSSDQGDAIVSLVPARGRLIVLFDPDDAGKKASKTVSEVVYGRIQMWNMELPRLRVPEGVDQKEMTDDQYDMCKRVDPGNATDTEFDGAYRDMTRVPVWGIAQEQVK